MKRRWLCVGGGGTSVVLVVLLWTVATAQPQSQPPPHARVKRADSTSSAEYKDRKGYRLRSSNALADSTRSRLTRALFIDFSRVWMPSLVI